jgi:hypothetical protein
MTAKADRLKIGFNQYYLLFWRKPTFWANGQTGRLLLGSKPWGSGLAHQARLLRDGT